MALYKTCCVLLTYLALNVFTETELDCLLDIMDNNSRYTVRYGMLKGITQIDDSQYSLPHRTEQKINENELMITDEHKKSQHLTEICWA